MSDTDRADVIPLREQHRQDTRRHIVAAARDLFASVGFAGATMEAVAERAGVSRATLFNYFPSKQLLVLPFAAQLMGTRVRPEVEAALDPWPGLPAALGVAFDSMERHVFSLPDIRGALREAVLTDLQGRSGPRPPQEGDILREILERAAARGELRQDIPVPVLARLVALLLIGDRLAPDPPTLEAGPPEHRRDHLLRFLGPALAGGK